MNSVITKVQVEGNDVVSFLNGTDYVASMSQVMPQIPTYISYSFVIVIFSPNPCSFIIFVKLIVFLRKYLYGHQKG